MTAQNFIARIAFDPLSALIPVDHVTGRIEHEDCIVGNPLDKKAETPLRLFKLGDAGRKLLGALRHAGFKRLIECQKSCFERLTFGNFVECAAQQG